ncbi:MAG: nucleotidyltransferase family protein [Christensenellales bacterium]|jgi:predicted nucleotidyltransferase
MQVLGIICEYNPLHSGHMHHFLHARDACGADLVICVMSTVFTQRGEAAVADPYLRARWALEMGADAVIALPNIFSMAPAPIFAKGGVEILAKTGMVTHIGFGSECGDPQLLQALAEISAHETGAFKSALARHLKGGGSYPAAFAAASGELLPGGIDKELAAKVLSSPNDVLALEYIKAIIRGRHRMEPVVIKREAPHRATAITGEMASSTAIRRDMLKGEDRWKSAVPAFVRASLEEAVQKGDAPISNDCFNQFICAGMRVAPPEAFTRLPDWEEGLEHVLKRAAGGNDHWHAMLMSAKSKRYTYTRLQRMMWYALLGVTKQFRDQAAAAGPQYLRVLGVKNTAVLSHLKASATLPLWVRNADISIEKGSLAQRMLAFDARCFDLYALTQKTDTHGGRWYSQPLIVLEK